MKKKNKNKNSYFVKRISKIVYLPKFSFVCLFVFLYFYLSANLVSSQCWPQTHCTSFTRAVFREAMHSMASWSSVGSAVWGGYRTFRRPSLRGSVSLGQAFFDGLWLATHGSTAILLYEDKNVTANLLLLHHVSLLPRFSPRETLFLKV